MTRSGEMEPTTDNARLEQGDGSSSAEALRRGSNGDAFRYVHQVSMAASPPLNMYQASMAEPPPINSVLYQTSMVEPQLINRDVYQASMVELGVDEQSLRKAAMGLQTGSIRRSMGDTISSTETGQINRDEACMAEPGTVEERHSLTKVAMVLQNGSIVSDAIPPLEVGRLNIGVNPKTKFPRGSCRKACILSIDGGGMRGIIPAKVLCYIEDRLKEKTGNPEAQIVDFFDIVAGTSVGGLIATMLCTNAGHGQPLFTAQEAWRLIAQKGKLIFKIPPLKRPFAMLRGILTPRYSVKNMESILKEYLVEDGQQLTLKDALKPLLIPCYNLTTAGAFVFSRADARKGDTHNYRLMDVCRATSAVPGFFKPATFSSLDGKTSIIGIDGGLVMNNPAAAAVTHVLNNKEEFPYVHGVADTLVLSLGTGLFDRPYNAKKVRHWGAFQWAKPVARIVLDGISDMVDHSMSMAFSHHSSNYVRIQVSGLPTRCLTEMDDASTSNVRRLTKIADDMLMQPCMQHIPFAGRQQLSMTNKERLDWLVDCLIAEQHSRLKSSSP